MRDQRATSTIRGDRLSRSEALGVLLEPLNTEEFGANRFVYAASRNRWWLIIFSSFYFRFRFDPQRVSVSDGSAPCVCNSKYGVKLNAS
jgi:hypothetical protein